MRRILNFLSNLFTTKEEVVVSQSAESAKYFLNDPTTFHLYEPQYIAKHPVNLPFAVDGFSPNSINSNQSEIVQAINCDITICNSLNNFQNIVTQLNHPIKYWTNKKTLKVIPRAGKDFNAYYDRNSLSFFYNVDTKIRKMVYTVDSIDIVAHELGHGILDAIRPDLWSTQSLEVWSFHEAFGDINAMVTIALNEKVLNNVLEETNGDIKLSNVISRIAEELGNAIYNSSANKNGRKFGYLRDASIPFLYVNPTKLPPSGTDDKLFGESHSFGRVFLSAWYQVVVKIYEAEQLNMGNIKALKFAFTTAYRYLIKAVIIVPNTLKFTEAVAKSMIIADQLEGGKYKHILETVFYNFKIITPMIKMLSNLKLDDIKINDNDQIIHDDNLIIINKKQNNIFKISDHFAVSLSENINPLFNVEMVVPSDESYCFDKNGNLTDETIISNDDLLQSSLICALSINSHDALGEGKMWEIVNNKLVRNHIQCKCCRG